MLPSMQPGHVSPTDRRAVLELVLAVPRLLSIVAPLRAAARVLSASAEAAWSPVRAWGWIVAFRWWREIPQLLLIIAMFGVSALAWAAAPDLLPVHWNAAGEIDRYGSKAEALLTVPAIAVVIYLVLLAAPRLARATEAQLGRLYLVVRCLVLLMLAWVHILLVLQIGGTPLDLGRLIPVSVGLLFIALGSFMGRVEPNAIMGVRTPWTLSSRAAWDDSQRVGGWLFMGLGVLLIAAGALSQPWFTVTVLALLPISIIALVWRGYVVCKADPDRLPPGKTLISSP